MGVLMMTMHETETLLLGADFGTQGVRVAVFDRYGGLLEMSFAAYPTFYPRPGWAEQDPRNWWDAFKQALAECLKGVKSPEKIKGMTICSTSSTVLAVDDGGNPLMRAILWMDNRAVAEAGIINNTGHPRLKYSGGADSVEWMIPKTLWIKNNLKDIYHAARLIVEKQDWINYRLTGRWVSSRCTATCKWNYADIDGGWSDDFMREIGLADYRDKLPVQVVPVGRSVGEIRREAAWELGLPAGITVFQGGIDAHIGLLGLGAVEPGQMGVIMGTSFVHLTLSSGPIFRPGLWGPYPNALVDGLWLLEGGQVSCGSLTRWFKDHLAPDLKYSHPGDEPYRVLAGEAARVPPGSEGLVVLDTWQGNRTPYRDPLATGCMWGLTLSHTRAHLYRAILESVAYGTRNILESFAAANLEINEIIACGGVLNNQLWLQIIADVTGVPIRKAGFGEAGVLGCAVCAAAGLGLYPGLTAAAQSMVEYGETVYPAPDHTRVYSFYFEQYKKTYELLAPQMHLLHTFRRNGGEGVGRK
jgi:FGGY-family pentulose kinase